MKVTTAPPPPPILIELSQDEAETLRVILLAMRWTSSNKFETLAEDLNHQLNEVRVGIGDYTKIAVKLDSNGEFYFVVKSDLD